MQKDQALFAIIIASKSDIHIAKADSLGHIRQTDAAMGFIARDQKMIKEF